MSVVAHEAVADGALLLDVRSPEEYATRHLPGAVNIPVDSLVARLAEVPKDRTVVVYCGAGFRSARAGEVLRTAGYQVLDLGGMDAWYQADSGPPAR